MKIQIGSQYIDPTIDNPILRTMPRTWKLETEQPKPALDWQRIGDRMPVWVCVLVIVLAACQVIR